jgi:hypothetical protein
MKLNRDVLATAIIKHQMTFFKLLDYIDNHDGSLEFPEHLYLNLYNIEICSDSDDNNTHYHLSVASLIENGVFIHNDKNTGMINIERVIVDLLRFLDIKRAKELTHFDFEHLRKRTVDITQEVVSFDTDSQNYQDAMESFNGLMSEIHSKIKENVNGLTAQVDSIAKDYKLYDTGFSDISVFDLYEKVTTLYTRYVLPCYEFINPEMEMVRTKTFSNAVQGIIEYHSEESLKQYKMANSIQFRKTAITSYYKNIAALARKLEQFSNHLDQDRSYFLAIESAYSELMDSIIPLRHGKQRNKYLMPNAIIFEKFTVLDGLSESKSKYSARLNWNKGITKLRFKEYLSVINESHIKEKNIVLKPLSPRTSISQERQILISKLLFSTNIPDCISNIHQFIYDELRNTLDNFELADVLFGLEAFLSMLDQERIIPTFKRHQLTDENYFLYYIELELRKEMIDV